MKVKKTLFAAAAVFFMAACGGQGTTNAVSSSAPTELTPQQKYGDFIWSKMDLKPAMYAAVENKGTVVDEEYDTYAYAYDVRNKNAEKTTAIKKKCQVYLPYGYDASKKYDIAYVMHGGGDNERYWLTTKGEWVVPTIDNLMFNKKCREAIIVCPTFYSYPEGYTPEGGMQASLDLPRYFPMELENELIPFIEAKYHTYADKDVSEASIIASRERRAFMGLSMGSMTSQEVLCAAPDKFAYIGSFSGEMSKNDEDYGFARLNASLHSEEFNKYKINFWYNQNGTKDIAHDPHEELSKHVLKDMSDKFVDTENYAWIDIKGGSHAFNCWWVGLYNTLQLFFPVSK